MAKTKGECARLVVETLRTELGELLQATLGVSADPRNPEAQESLKRFIRDGLSGTTEVSQAFIETGVSVGFDVCSDDGWKKKLEAVGITVDELWEHKFLTRDGFDASAVVEANGYVDASRSDDLTASQQGTDRKLTAG